MNTDFDGKLNYRDYVVHISTGLLFDVFLLAAVYPKLPPDWWEYDLQNELIWSLVAIPVLFLEGHFLLAIDRLLFVEIPSWYFGLKNKKDDNLDNDEYPKDEDSQDSAPYRHWRMEKYENCKAFFYLLFGKRVMGQMDRRRVKNEMLVKTTKENNLRKAARYDILSDFFTGVGCAAWISLLIASLQTNWCIVGCMFAIIILSWLRCRFFSSMYVKYFYKKNYHINHQTIKNQVI